MHWFSPYPSELARSIIFVEALDPKVNDDAILRAIPVPIPSNTLFVISPVSALANVAIAPRNKLLFDYMEPSPTRSILSLMWTVSLTTIERSFLITLHIRQGVWSAGRRLSQSEHFAGTKLSVTNTFHGRAKDGLHIYIDYKVVSLFVMPLYVCVYVYFLDDKMPIRWTWHCFSLAHYRREDNNNPSDHATILW